MKARKSIAARYWQLKSGHGLMATYQKLIRKREDTKCWWCGHECQTRDHLPSGVRHGNESKKNCGKGLLLFIHTVFTLARV